MKKNDLYTKALPFIICLEENSNDWTAQGKKCAASNGLDWAEISKCATSDEGLQYHADMGKITDALVPAHTYVPWVVVNDQHTSSSESGV